MPDKNVEIELNLLLPEIPDEEDECLIRLEDALRERKGITHVHLVRENGTAQLCIHYNPNLISLKSVRETAVKAGASLSNRYRHEQIPFEGMDTADEALTLRTELERIPGMIHAQVNYAAGLAFVAYDTRVLQPETIAQTMEGMGVKPINWSPAITKAGEELEHDHGSAPPFLPHWVQERWTLILVGLAGFFLLIGWSGETFFDMPEKVALGFYLLAYLAGGYDIATHAIPGLLKGKFDTDVLMLAAAGGAAILGEWTEGAFLLFLFSLGHAGEHYALGKARNAINALGELMPKTAQVKRGDEIVTLPVDQIQVGDLVVVRPGDRVPVDGKVASGESTIDQSPITGESVPVSKTTGDEVFAGTINQENALEVKVTRLAKDNTLARVMRLVAEAQSQQSPTQLFTDRFTRWFVPSVLVLVGLVIVVPPVIGFMTLNESLYRAMLLLVAASPCALALGTPATVLAGIAQAARNGVLIKGGAFLEYLGTVKVMAFDKTGTLTMGKFSLTDLIPMNGSNPDELLRIAAAVESSSNHPLALAIVRTAQEKNLQLPPASGLENISGRGVKSEIEGRQVLIGSLKLFRETDSAKPDQELINTIQALENEGKTTMAVQYDGRFLGVLALADTPRPGVKTTLQSLLDLGIQKLVMLTGDNEEVAQRIAEELGLTDVRAGLLPEQKLTAVKQLQEEYGEIAMTGDGINDAPALASATVGIAMGGAGTAVALETADVALMADDLSKLPFAVGLSRASRSIIVQNLVIALGVIGILLVTSVAGIMELSWAVLLHEGSSIVVVLNALRLLRYQWK
jgi:Cd2+/Zn2+-exporting ATPase